MPTTVSEGAVFSRLRRKFLKDGERLMRCQPGSKWFSDLGHYYTVDCQNHTSATHLDLESAAREAGVLLPSESIADE